MSSRDAQSERVQELEAENRRLKASAGTGVDTAVAEVSLQSLAISDQFESWTLTYNENACDSM